MPGTNLSLCVRGLLCLSQSVLTRIFWRTNLFFDMLQVMCVCIILVNIKHNQIVPFKNQRLFINLLYWLTRNKARRAMVLSYTNNELTNRVGTCKGTTRLVLETSETIKYRFSKMFWCVCVTQTDRKKVSLMEVNSYYHVPNNRFWKITVRIFLCPIVTPAWLEVYVKLFY